MNLIGPARILSKPALFVVMLIFVLSNLVASSVAQNSEPVSTLKQPRGTPPSDVSPTGTTATDPLALSEKDLIEQAFRQIDTEARRLDRLIANVEIVGKVVATLILGLSVVVSIFAFRSLSELRRELQSSVEEHVDRALRKESERKQTFQALLESLKQAETKWEEIKASIQHIEGFYTITETLVGDAQGAYKAVSEISNKPTATEDDRRVALTYLRKLIQLGVEGRVDPNILFNATSAASKLDFDFEALQIAALCAHWDPKPSHIARKNRLEDIFGARFVLRDNHLERDEVSANVVRSEAWTAALEQVRRMPTIQCELILSEAHNIAVRNRESGFMDELITVIETSSQSKDNRQTPSYLYVILGGLYAMRGNLQWREGYEDTITKALQILKQESPSSTWYWHTIRDLLSNTTKLGERVSMVQRLKDAEVPMPSDSPED